METQGAGINLRQSLIDTPGVGVGQGGGLQGNVSLERKMQESLAYRMRWPSLGDSLRGKDKS